MTAKIANWVFVAFLAAVCTYLTARGVELIQLGGSWYYTICGLAMGVVAVLLIMRKALAAFLWTAIVAVTLVWSIYEAGIEVFALLARLGAFIIVGIWFLTPWYRNSVGEPLSRRAGGAWAGLASAAGVLVLIVASFQGYRVEEGTRVAAPSAPVVADWRNPGNSPGGSRFSPLEKINVSNVGGLKEVWRIRTGIPFEMKATPLLVDNTMYVCAVGSQVLALDAQNGEEHWRFDPKTKVPGARPGILQASLYARTCRALGYYEGAADTTGACAKRIIVGTTDARMLAVDAATGQVCREFGIDGAIDLMKGMGPHDAGNYMVTSGVVIAGKVAVVGGWVSDNQELGNASGVIRAYNAETGRFAWAWDMGNPGFHGEPADGKTYTPGTPNVWSFMSYDPVLNLIYAPTGNAAPDYYGPKRRPFDEEYSSSTVALDAATGDVRWAYQNVHHDVWDYDSPSQPTLVDVMRNGVRVPAVVQPTKRGELFLLDRRTGAPLAPATRCDNGAQATEQGECPVPQGAVAGDSVAPTQPFSGLPSFRPDRLEKDMWGLTPLDTLFCRIEYKKMRYEGHFTPIMRGGGGGQSGKPTFGGTFEFPGNVGGFNWANISVDADNGLLVAQPMLIGNRVAMVTASERAQITGAAQPASAVDHGAADMSAEQGEWDPDAPRYAVTAPFVSTWKLPFTTLETGLPCTEPPYGKLAVIDLNTSKLLWSRPIGNMRYLGPFGIKSGLPITVGTTVYGGTIATRGGLIFQVGTMDATIRAIELRTGKTKWSALLPGTTSSTPITYLGPDGRQYVAVVISNPGYVYPRVNVPPTDDKGGWVIAYALDGN